MGHSPAEHRGQNETGVYPELVAFGRKGQKP